MKNEVHQRGSRGVEWDQGERVKVTGHWGDIRSLLCEQSPATGEQSRSLELRYCRLVGPSVWKCTCRRAGLWLWTVAWGGVGFSGGLSVSCQFVWDLHYTHSSYSYIFTASVCSGSPKSVSIIPSVPSHTSFSSAPSYLLFPVSCALLTILLIIVIIMPPPSSPYAVLHSSPPSFKCW